MLLKEAMELEPGVDYALICKRLENQLRPIRGVREEQGLRLYDPEGGPDHWIGLKGGEVLSLDVGWEIAPSWKVVGKWTDPTPGNTDLTWQGMAAHAYGEVLRQHALVDRLAKFGIKRSYEPYLLTEESPNAVDRALWLNFDELDALLDVAEKAPVDSQGPPSGT